MHALLIVVVEHEFVGDIIVTFCIMLDPRDPFFVNFFYSYRSNFI